ncbi:MAG: formyl transferase [Gammaproteobacteria bacterium]|nr:formyl transferase [Gammaproteobacteria bacterium]MBU0788287.1 formyl transferase [Gammaproteobacteria bacterium]MBU0815216.1 formyl transferase [Gammaproteobacteria bacterium]MBU1785676.1 formyl transferase [Gammaproteobacteria bacterium]
MRIVFIGAVSFSASMLEVLLRMKAEIVGVCTLSRAPSNSDHADLSEQAHRAGIPVLDAPDINAAQAVEWIRRLAPDVIFCLGWSRLIRPELLGLAPLGVVGYHPAELPANRGRHPLIWALALGLEKTASTFFLMDEGADSGDILSQLSVPIQSTDDAASLYERITDVAAAQLRDMVLALASGRYDQRPQDTSQANLWRKRGRLDGQIDWRMTAVSIHNLVRALTKPYPGAHFVHHDLECKVWKAEIVPEPRRNLEPGKVLAIDASGFTVKAGVDAVRMLMVEPLPALRLGDYL